MKLIFPFGKPAKGKDLIDRKEEVSDIITDLSGGQSLVLASPRRLGKSSVVLEALRKLKRKGFLTAYIDLFKKTDLREFAEGIIESVLENETNQARKIIKLLKKNISDFVKIAQFKYIWKDNEFILSLGDRESDPHKLLEDALNFPENFAKKYKKKIIIAIDEFGELINWNGKLLKKMRAKFQQHTLTTYIFTGSQESMIRQLFTGKAQAFYGFAKVIGLGPLARADLTKYLIKTFKKGKIKMSEDVTMELGSKTKFHPHYTKILAQSVYDLISKEKNSIEKEDIQKGFEKALLYLKGELDREWGSLSRAPLQKKILKFLGMGGELPYSKLTFPNLDKAQIYLALTELEQKGIITKISRAKYEFVNPFFPDYIQMLEKGEF